MSSSDEYDVFYPPFDSAALAEIEDLRPAAPLAINTHHVEQRLPHVSLPPPDASAPPSPDEFDAYFSGFTAQDYAEIDASALAAHAAASPPLPPPRAGTSGTATGTGGGGGAFNGGGGGAGSGGGRAGASGGSGNGGPRIEITVERARKADARPSVKARRGPRPKRSPYEQFRSWRGQLSVTDLAGPSW